MLTGLFLFSYLMELAIAAIPVIGLAATIIYTIAYDKYGYTSCAIPAGVIIACGVDALLLWTL